MIAAWKNPKSEIFITEDMASVISCWFSCKGQQTEMEIDKYVNHFFLLKSQKTGCYSIMQEVPCWAIEVVVLRV